MNAAIWANVAVNGADFQQRYLALIAALPSAEISVPPDPVGISAFRFDGGDGRIMPMRPRKGMNL